MTVVLLDPYRYATAGGPILKDTFTRADGTGLGNAETGQAWTVDGADFVIASGRARPPVVAGYKFALADLGTTDVDITVDVVPSALSGNDVFLVARWVDSGNHLLFNVVKDVGGWLSRAFEKVGGGSYTGVTTLANPPTGIGNNFDPFRARLKVDGNQGEVFLTSQADLGTWISQGTWTINAALLSATVHGFGANASERCEFDNIEAVAP